MATCAEFIEQVAASSMMGAGLAIAGLPLSQREEFIERLAEDVTALAVKVHAKIHKHLNTATPPTTPPEPARPPTEPRRFTSNEFITFDEAMLELNIDETRLKRFVSEGEIRCFRDGDHMKFKRQEIQNMKRTYKETRR